MIEDLLNAASTPDMQFCPRCGKEMNYVPVTISLYGTEAEWEVPLPACDCAVKSRTRIN
jgi:hypothetical protein